MEVFCLFFVIMFISMHFYLKYTEYTDMFKQEPSFKEVWEYKFVEKSMYGRYSKYLKALCYFAVFLGLLFYFATKGMGRHPTGFENREVWLISLRASVFFVAMVNLQARLIIRRLMANDPERHLMPLFEFYDAYRKTGWIVKKKGFISDVVNTTSLLLVASLAYLIFLYFG